MSVPLEKSANPGRYLSLNKYFLYIAVLLIVFGFLLVPKLYYRLTFAETTGRVTGYHEVWRSSKSGGYYEKYPIIEFQTQGLSVRILAPSFMYHETEGRQTYKVIYDTGNPQKAYVHSFQGLWGTPFTFLIPFFLMWSGCIFSIGFIPTTIKIPW